MARITVRLFAQARVAAGRARWDIEVGPEGLPVAELLERLKAEFPRLGPVLRTCRFVRNGALLRGTTGRVRPGDDFALHPPYSGG